MNGLGLSPAFWICKVSYKNRYAGLLILHLLPFFNFLYSCERSSHYCNRLHDFSVTIFYGCLMAIVSFLPELDSKQSQWALFIFGFFLTDFLICFSSLLILLFLVTLCLVVAPQSCLERIPN